MKNKILAILYSGDDARKKIPFTNSIQRECYEQLYALAEKEYQMTIVRVCIDWFQGKSFRQFWAYKNKRWQKITRSIIPDIILDKSAFAYETIPVKKEIATQYVLVNPWELELLVSDKLFLPILFPQYIPYTTHANTSEELRAALRRVPGKKVVIKPRIGLGGAGIIIAAKSAIREKQIRFPIIVQEFIDTQKGIPNVYPSIHDLRMLFTGEKIIGAYIRTPAPGTLLCNMSQQGGARFISISEIPKTVFPIIRSIQKSLSLFPYKVYTADFFFTNGRPLIVELNAKADFFFPPEFLKNRTKLYHAYLRYFSTLVA
ncbi:MAG: ATP-grasp domain-containing protein [Candidatus Kerfeldbacteria bacterium]|nr:ATP-grasp domain-containing protein [Candidatus Kerfeldbacteria bacterium]